MPRANNELIIRHDLANTLPYNLVGDHLKFSNDYVFFANLNLDAKAIEACLTPLLDLVGQRIAFTYKSPAKFSFLGINGIVKLKLSDWLQFDDVCVKLLHVDTGFDILITISTQIARTLLIRLLSTTLVDDTHGVLFSSTEKGILCFVIARLLLDLKRTLGDGMPDVKLIGIYHCQDESINEIAITDHGVFNFSLTFAHDLYPVSVALPTTIFHTIKPIKRKLNLIPRCGHISALMKFAIATLAMTPATIADLSFGDLIIFDRARLSLTGGRLDGTLHGIWHNIVVSGNLHQRRDHFVFSPHFTNDFACIEDIKMENISIADAKSSAPSETDAHHGTLADLAKNIRVPLSIELARLPLTLKEVCQIREGEILDLHRKIGDPLDMVVEDKVIGHCQPVQIDGRLGIRVLSIDDHTFESKS